MNTRLNHAWRTLRRFVQNIAKRGRPFWNRPRMMRWGRLAIMLAFVIPIFFFFLTTEARNDELILVSIATALYIGIGASIGTTETYTARSLGLFALIAGSAIYFTYLYLVYAEHVNHDWMADLTRAFFIVGSPLFAISTVVALIQRTRIRRDERNTQK